MVITEYLHGFKFTPHFGFCRARNDWVNRFSEIPLFLSLSAQLEKCQRVISLLSTAG